MADAAQLIAERMGGLKRIVLGHAHADHRGAAPQLGAPVLCHDDAKAEAETAGEPPYADYSTIPATAAPGYRLSEALRRSGTAAR